MTKYLVKYDYCQGYEEWEVTNEDKEGSRLASRGAVSYELTGNSVLVIRRNGKKVASLPQGEVYEVLTAVLLMHQDSPLLGKVEVIKGTIETLYGGAK